MLGGGLARKRWRFCIQQCSITRINVGRHGPLKCFNQMFSFTSENLNLIPFMQVFIASCIYLTFHRLLHLLSVEITLFALNLLLILQIYRKQFNSYHMLWHFCITEIWQFSVHLPTSHDVCNFLKVLALKKTDLIHKYKSDL